MHKNRKLTIKSVLVTVISYFMHFNPLGPKSDQHQISPCIITAL